MHNTCPNTKGLSSILRKLRHKTDYSEPNKKIWISTEETHIVPVAVPSSKTSDYIQLDDSRSCDEPDMPSLEKTDSSNSGVKSKEQVKVKGFSCSVCGYVAPSTHRLKEHLSRHSGAKHLECNICGKKFAWRYSLKIHMTKHMENNPNKCTMCDKTYCSNSTLKKHMLRVHGNPKKDFKCQKCGKDFVTKGELGRHSINHSEEKSFICEYCGNAYKFKSALLVHYKTHTNEKPYKCKFCEKEFLHLSSAIGHKRRHTGEKPFQCQECKKSFHVKREMTAHKSVHNNIGQFQCTKCEKQFKSRNGFHIHLEFHLGAKRHACKYCGKRFRAWSNMHKHMKQHLSKEIHKCEVCNKTFTEKPELKNHLKCHKNDTKPKKSYSNCDTEINSEILSAPNLNSSCGIEPSVYGTAEENDISHIDITNNEAIIYDYNIHNTIDKSPTDKCQILQDNYVSQFLYPQHPSLQYAQQSVPLQNIYSTVADQLPQRSSCTSNMNSNFNCVPLNPNFNAFSYNLPSSEELLLKCKLCRSLFNSPLVLRNHLLDYHRIEEENIDSLLT